MLLVPGEALYVALEQEAQTEAPVALVVRQANQPIGYGLIFSIELGLITVASLADAEGHTGTLDSHAAGFDVVAGHLTSARWLIKFSAPFSPVGHLVEKRNCHGLCVS
ncbi:hypothetical protein ASE26_24980 [Duganella sp. Root198D2]|nr:hypothetical protein ASE26_24980 [Duganella sp. Root198D2]